jgi:hypothetical protein
MSKLANRIRIALFCSHDKIDNTGYRQYLVKYEICCVGVMSQVNKMLV